MSDGEAALAASAQHFESHDKSNNAAAVQLSNLRLHGASHGSEEEEIKQVKVPRAAVSLPRGTRFCSIIASFYITGLLSALENTVVITSLSTIVRDRMLATTISGLPMSSS